MADYAANTTSDFNGDGTFTDCDADIGWAYLQVKALIDNGGLSEPADQSALETLVKDQYQINVNAQMATAGCGDIANLPVDVDEPVVATPIEYSDVLGYWRLNEAGPEYDKTVGRSSNVWPLTDSSMNDQMAVAFKLARDPASESDKYGYGLLGWSTITFQDASGELFSNSGDWTFHAKIRVTSGLKFQIEKGNFKMTFHGNQIYANNIGGELKAFAYPPGKNVNSFDGKFVDLFLVKTGSKFGMYVVDGNEVVSFGSKQVSGNFFASPDADVKLSGKGAGPMPGARAGYKLCWFSEMYILGKALLEDQMSSTFYNPAEFRVIYDAELPPASGNVLIDPSTNKSVTLVGGINEANHNGTGGYTGNKYYKLKPGDTSYLNYDGFDFTEDFTFSFWFRSPWTKQTSGIVQIVDASNATNKLVVSINKTKSYLVFNNGANAVTQEITLSSEIQAQTWYHFSFVKNNGKVAMYIDGTYAGGGWAYRNYSGGATLEASSIDTGMTNCKLQISSTSGSGDLHIADVSLINGGLVRVDSTWNVKQGGQPNDASLINAVKSATYFA